MAITAHIPGQAYEFATVASIKARIAHLEWLFAAERITTYQGPGAADLLVELDMLKYQWLGNALIRERGAL